jgi:hypothetical protein
MICEVYTFPHTSISQKTDKNKLICSRIHRVQKLLSDININAINLSHIEMICLLERK